MEKKYVRVIRRGIMDIPQFCYSICILILIAMIYFVPGASSGWNTSFLRETLLIALGVVFFVVLFWSFAKLKTLNDLLANGKVKWATVDMDMSNYAETFSVYCYEENDYKRYYKATVSLDRKMAVTVKNFLRQQGKIPVIVDENGGSNYVVLLKEIVRMCDLKKSSSYQIDVVRTIEWMQ